MLYIICEYSTVALLFCYSDVLADLTEESEDSDDEFLDIMNSRGVRGTLSNSVSPRQPILSK